MIQFFFIEKSLTKKQVITPNQGYLVGFINIHSQRNFPNDHYTQFLEELLEELNFSVKNYEIFKDKQFEITQYLFWILIDNEIRIFHKFDHIAMRLLLKFEGKLIIAEANFPFKDFLSEPIFLDWKNQVK